MSKHQSNMVCTPNLAGLQNKVSRDRLQKKVFRDKDLGGLGALLKTARREFAHLADCDVIVGDARFPCHTAVLYARSSYFRSRLIQQVTSANQATATPTVTAASTTDIVSARRKIQFQLEIIPDSKAVELVLSYIYSGHVPLDVDHTIAKDTQELALLFELPMLYHVIARRFSRSSQQKSPVHPDFTLQQSFDQSVCSDYQVWLWSILLPLNLGENAY